MAAHDKVRWHPPLRAPAIEVVDLLSDSDSTDTALRAKEHNGEHDAYSTILSAQETADGDVQWCAPLKAPAIAFDDSLSRDVPRRMSEVLVSAENAKAGDASAGGSDSDEDSQWSLYEDALGGDEDEVALHSSDGSCSLEESLAFRKRLRLIGGDRFLAETVEAGAVTAKKLCTAFGIRLPFFLEGEPDEAYYSLLDLAICRELSKRAKLPQHNTIDDAVALLKKSRNVIVLTGAGISTSLGIPDFRSKETGLYSQLQHLGLGDPQEVFDISLFREDPSIFYSVAKDILPSSKKFSPTHAFIRLLQDKNKLLTNFTQNIDNLEGCAGILPEKLIQCHGSFATATCIECKYKVKCGEIYKELKAGRVARCDRCIRSVRQAKPGLKRKRISKGSTASRKKRQSYEDSTDDEDNDIAVAGVMKPDITFFGEDLPATFHDRLMNHDRDLVDLVLVIGTSLKVAPVSEVVGVLPHHVPQLYISREPCSHANFDIDLLGDCDAVVTELCRRAGWDLQHEMILQDEKVDVQLNEGYESRFSFNVIKA
ncbi:MAG: NAD-dependent histone deacetylase sir2 [Alectoria fallacina]|uniref:NAD-dependent histone deacetylase sir2 n=1 Tax=Alectoria fallacina TaxID=1903189 RepID=A0A8H3EYU1_9LECA|nr:MAG: NAD-dependent histone deacetylase sir2 [Alectoria fallacina]